MKYFLVTEEFMLRPYLSSQQSGVKIFNTFLEKAAEETFTALAHQNVECRELINESFTTGMQLENGDSLVLLNIGQILSFPVSFLKY